jgi:hypothetical protein
VGAWILAGVALLTVLAWQISRRRRAARRAAAARARARARRRRAPLVSANLRGQGDRKSDIWREAQAAVESEDRMA